MYFPNEDVFVTALFNADNENYLGLFEEIADLAIDKPLSKSYLNTKVEDSLLNRCTGTYHFIEDATQSISVYKENDRLYADLSNRSGMHMALLPQSNTLFYLPDVRRIPTTIEFIVEGEKITGLYWTQEKKHACVKK